MLTVTLPILFKTYVDITLVTHPESIQAAVVVQSVPLESFTLTYGDWFVVWVVVNAEWYPLLFSKSENPHQDHWRTSSW